jgi:hypothetical protein
MAFVLGGGGVLGAYGVGMLRALSEAGTSVGAINGAFIAADPAGAAAFLTQAWQGEALQQAFTETIFSQVARLAMTFRAVGRSRPRALRLLFFALAWLTAETVALSMCLGLWVASGFGGRLRTEPYQARHYAVMKWFLDQAGALVIFPEGCCF